MSLIYILLALVVLLVMITVHEFGHYIAGKIFGFKINEFSIGFGPALYKRTRKDGEIFAIRALPLGGYCAFEGEDEEGKDIYVKLAYENNRIYIEKSGSSSDDSGNNNGNIILFWL